MDDSTSRSRSRRNTVGGSTRRSWSRRNTLYAGRKIAMDGSMNKSRRNTVD